MKKQMNQKQQKKPAKKAAPIAYRYSCNPDGSSTGLSHYILIDKKAGKPADGGKQKKS
jgi:modified peptide precursor CbpA